MCPWPPAPPHYNFTNEWGESGSDVESMANAVNDFCINESPPSTKYVDFLRSISDNKKAIVEVEGSEYRNTMANFLHGLSALSLYWGWADRAGDGGAVLYGRGTRPPFCTVAEAERFLRTALDVRRLEKEILAFRETAAPVALLYSKASMLQVPPGSGDKTPYLLELEHCYNAMLQLGVPVDFVTTKQVLEGKLSRYKLLVVPAATYEHAAVVEKIMTFAESGGQVVLVPNSWFFDQYARKQPYLGSLGVSVTSMKAPRIKAGAAKTGIQRDVAGEETEAPFLMGLIVDTVVTDVPKAVIKTADRGLFAGSAMTSKTPAYDTWPASTTGARCWPVSTKASRPLSRSRPARGRSTTWPSPWSRTAWWNCSTVCWSRRACGTTSASYPPAASACPGWNTARSNRPPGGWPTSTTSTRSRSSESSSPAASVSAGSAISRSKTTCRWNSRSRPGKRGSSIQQ